MRIISPKIKFFIRLSRAAGSFAAIKITFWNLIGRRGQTSIQIDGLNIKFRLQSPDLRVVVPNLGDELEPVKKFLNEDFNGLIIDAGGYIGTAAIKFAQMYPHANIITIEPSKENFEILVKNTQSFHNILPINAALVGSDRKSVNLLNRGTGQWGYTIIEDPRDCDNPQILGRVDAISLREVKRQFGDKEIGILKLDIEGAEKDLFDNKEEILDSVNLIFVELHDKIQQGCTSSFREFCRERRILKFKGEKYLAVSK